MSTAIESPAPPSPTWIKVVRFLAFIGLPVLFVGFLAYGLFIARAKQDLAGKPGPEFRLQILGENESLTDFELRGDPTVINFWASWCTPCREEAPTFETKWRKYKDEGVNFVGVNIQDAEQDALEFVRDFGITYPSVRDLNLDLYTSMGVRGLPETFFLNGDWVFVGDSAAGEVQGTLRSFKVLGAVPSAVLESRIAALLGK